MLRHVKPIVNLNFGSVVSIIELVTVHGLVAVQIITLLVPVRKINSGIADDLLP